MVTSIPAPERNFSAGLKTLKSYVQARMINQPSPLRLQVQVTMYWLLAGSQIASGAQVMPALEGEMLTRRALDQVRMLSRDSQMTMPLEPVSVSYLPPLQYVHRS